LAFAILSFMGLLLVCSCCFPAMFGACLSSLCCCCFGAAAGAGAAATAANNVGSSSSQKYGQEDNLYHSYPASNGSRRNSFNGSRRNSFSGSRRNSLNNKQNGNGHDNDAELKMFDENVQRAKLEIETSRTMHPTISPPSTTPYSGEYITSYVDGGVAHSATLTIQFTDLHNNTGYKLSGRGKDVDGTTLIEDGHANYDGTVWWRERTVTGDVGLQILSRGKFDFSKSTLDGTWFASSGQGGSYLAFHANWNQQTTHPTPNAPPADETVYPGNEYALFGGENNSYSNATSLVPVPPPPSLGGNGAYTNYAVTGLVMDDTNGSYAAPTPYVPQTTTPVTVESTPYVPQTATPVTVVAEPIYSTK